MEEKTITIEEMANTLLKMIDEGSTGFEIYYHKRPDGDAIGSAYALGLGLSSLGASVRVPGNEPVPEVFSDLTSPAERMLSCEHADRIIRIAVDTASAARLGKNADLPMDIVIDHHVTNIHTAPGRLPAPLRYVDPSSSSCAEIILEILENMNVKITPRIADFLYTGLVTDVACFKTRSTNAASLKAAARLTEYGARIVDIARRQYMRKTPAQIGMEKELFDRISCSGDNEVIGSYVTAEDYKKHGITDSELVGFVDTLDQICKPDKEYAHAHVVVRELQPGFCRISVTAKLPVNAARICSLLGGGGHDNAAGAEMNGKPEDVLRIFMEACEADVKEYL